MSISATFHPQTDRHLAADGGDPAARPERLRAVAAGGVAEHRLADDPVAGCGCAALLTLYVLLVLQTVGVALPAALAIAG